MPIEAEQQPLHYRIVERIGDGGMGELWTVGFLVTPSSRATLSRR